jgi:hypothetical protein
MAPALLISAALAVCVVLPIPASAREHRSASVKREFQLTHPCPATERTSGPYSPSQTAICGDDFDELKICVRSRREEGRIPPPGRDDNDESADERSALECAAAGRSPNEYHVSLHDWSTVGRTLQLGLSRATRFLIGDGKRERPVST